MPKIKDGFLIDDDITKQILDRIKTINPDLYKKLLESKIKKSKANS